MFGVLHPLKVGGLRPPTFPRTYTLAPGFFFDFSPKKFRFEGLDFLFKSFLFVHWGVLLIIFSPTHERLQTCLRNRAWIVFEEDRGR